MNDANRERIHWQRWLEMVEADAKREITAFCQPRIFDGAPLTSIALKPLAKERE